jgi:hypothetical protein
VVRSPHHHAGRAIVDALYVVQFRRQNGRENIGGWIELAAALAVVEERAMAIPSSR